MLRMALPSAMLVNLCGKIVDLFLKPCVKSSDGGCSSKSILRQLSWNFDVWKFASCLSFPWDSLKRFILMLSHAISCYLMLSHAISCSKARMQWLCHMCRRSVPGSRSIGFSLPTFLFRSTKFRSQLQPVGKR